MRSVRGCDTTRGMIDFVRFVRGVIADLVRPRVRLIAENALLRQQLIVAERKIVGRVQWAPWQRFTIGLAAGFAPAWRAAILLVQPATILRWHRRVSARCGGDGRDQRVDLSLAKTLS